MDRPKDYYQLLGVARDASPTTIRRAFARIRRRFQLGAPRDGSSEAFHELKQAYETLSNAERRRRYDEGLREPERDRFSALSWSFVRSPSAGDLRRPARPQTLSGELLLSPEEARSGGLLSVAVPAPAACPACHGTGGRGLACARCAGEGRVERRLPVVLRVPAGVRDGALFQVLVDDHGVHSVLFTIHLARA